MKLGKFKKVPEMIEFDGAYSVSSPKSQILTILVKKIERNQL